ncbi:MAG: DUF1444 family protein [Acidobacteria bacterium]|nr:DUF1444 family protein [Acidobacteriota bacterium]
MASQFTNKFKKNDLDEQRAFQVRCFRALSDIYPDNKFDLTDDPLTLTEGESTLGLTNVLAQFLLGSQTEADLRDILRAHVGKALSARPAAADRKDLSWEQAKQQLMPQLMPEQFISLSKLKLVNFEFGDGVKIGFVVDTEESYSYVSENDLERWSMSREVLHEAAMENLADRTNGIGMMAIPGPNAFIVVNTMDGFDAVRIVLPQIQQYFSETIGGPFFFGVPNRDFLICWSKAGDEQFQSDMRSQISRDFDQQPYPLSRRAFEVTADGIRLDPLTGDPATISFSNN